MKKTTLLILLFLGINQTMLSIHLGARALAKKEFSGLMTGLHWSIAGFPVAAGTIQLLIHSNPKAELKFAEIEYGTLNDPNEISKKFIKEELAKRNTPVEEVKVMSKIGDRNMVLTAHHCLITEMIQEDIHKAVEENDEEIKKQLIATLNHESNHKKSKDYITKNLACIISPFITDTLTKKVNKLIVPSSMKINISNKTKGNILYFYW